MAEVYEGPWALTALPPLSWELFASNISPAWWEKMSPLVSTKPCSDNWLTEQYPDSRLSRVY